MNCAQCTSPLPADAVFCPNCGTRPSAGPTAAPAGGAKTFSGLNTIAPIRESQASVLEPGTMFADRYEVIRKIGEGGMGIAYVARDTNTKEEIVVKLIHPNLVAGEEALNRLMSEGLTARQIRHPNIVAVYDVALSDGQAYFTMEFVKGGTLRSWMNTAKRSGREISVQTAAGLMTSMLGGVAEAHRLGFIHRGLKPENVLLSGEPDTGDFGLKILDFGIAKAVGAVSATSGTLGTPPYMAPEQGTSAEAVGPTADFYSLSVMLYELLMEAPPLGRWEPVSESRPDVPKAIDKLLDKGLSARPRNRFASAAEFATAIDAAARSVRHGPPEPQPPPPPPEPQPLPPVPPPPQPPGPSPWAWLTGSTYFTTLPRRTKMWIGGGLAALVVVALIAENTPEPDPFEPVAPPPAQYVAPVAPENQPVQPVVPEPKPEPKRVEQKAAFNMSGVWLNDAGDRLTFNHDGVNVEGTGAVTGLGHVLVRGTFTGGFMRYIVYSTVTRQAIAEGTGQLQSDRRHINLDQINYGFGRIRGQLHFDHGH